MGDHRRKPSQTLTRRRGLNSRAQCRNAIKQEKWCQADTDQSRQVSQRTQANLSCERQKTARDARSTRQTTIGPGCVKT